MYVKHCNETYKTNGDVIYLYGSTALRIVLFLEKAEMLFSPFPAHDIK